MRNSLMIKAASVAATAIALTAVFGAGFKWR